MRSRNLALATLAVTAVMLHGSLYPYAFRVPHGTAGPLETLLRSWAEPPVSLGNILANILFYVPFGFLAALALRGRTGLRLAAAVFAGGAISLAVELAQFYDAGRVSNLSDVYLNTGGAALGAVAALLFGSAARLPSTRRIAAEPIPLTLLAAFLAYRLYPYVPVIGLRKYLHALKPVLVDPHLSPQLIFRYFAFWLTASCLTAAAIGGARSRLAALLLVAAVFAGKIVIATSSLTRPEVIGAALALLLWLAIGRRRRGAALVTAAVLGVLIVGERLAPFHFTATARSFGWLPFRSFLHGSLAVNTMSFLEKFFLYGSLVWLAVEAGLPLWPATALVAALLLLTSVAEVYVPGRSAEITDAVMVLMIGLVMAPMRRRHG